MKLFGIYSAVLADLGITLTPESHILDWGCGAGALVAEGRSAGFLMFGCDFRAKGDYLAAIETGYRLPYEDQTFDVIISNQVLEHVMDYGTSLFELHRVLKPGGAFLHVFPSRWIPVEPHTFVPFATVLRNRAWLYLWSILGVRNSFQRGMTPLERANKNYRYLKDHTNYLSKRELAGRFKCQFTDVRFVEAAYLPHNRRAALRLSRHLPFGPTLYSSFHSRVVFGRRER